MSPPPHNGIVISNQQQQHHHHENFATFFEWWLLQQNRYLQELLSAASSPPPATKQEEDARITPLVSRVVSHYEYYYKTKLANAKRDVLQMFSPSWTSSTENLFLWVGGWRPSTAFHLLYSKSGLQLESHLTDLIRGVQTHNLSNLSCGQLERIDRLQKTTIRLEKEISEEEATVQETVADTQLVELTHAITEAENGGGDNNGSVEAMEAEMRGKREALEKVLEKADTLRLDTLKAVVEILLPMQAIHFLIAAAELHLRLHEFGKNKDAAAAVTDILVQTEDI